MIALRKCTAGGSFSPSMMWRVQRIRNAKTVRRLITKVAKGSIKLPSNSCMVVFTDNRASESTGLNRLEQMSSKNQESSQSLLRTLDTFCKISAPPIRAVFVHQTVLEAPARVYGSAVNQICWRISQPTSCLVGR